MYVSSHIDGRNRIARQTAMDVPNIQFLLIVGNHPVTMETRRLTFGAKFKGIFFLKLSTLKILGDFKK